MPNPTEVLMDEYRRSPQFAYDMNRAAERERDEANKITIRDQFAMAALTGFVATNKLPNSDRFEGMTGAEIFARQSYAVADAMLRARQTQGE